MTRPVFEAINNTFFVDLLPVMPTVRYQSDYINDQLAAFADVRITVDSRKRCGLFTPFADIRPLLRRYGIRCRAPLIHVFRYPHGPSRKNIMLLLLRRVPGIRHVALDESRSCLFVTFGSKKLRVARKRAGRIIGDVVGKPKLARLLVDDGENEEVA